MKLPHVYTYSKTGGCRGYSKRFLERDKLCKFYLAWKLHKKANALGVRSRPIASKIGYPFIFYTVSREMLEQFVLENNYVECDSLPDACIPTENRHCNGHILFSDLQSS